MQKQQHRDCQEQDEHSLQKFLPGATNRLFFVGKVIDAHDRSTEALYACVRLPRNQPMTPKQGSETPVWLCSLGRGRQSTVLKVLYRREERSLAPGCGRICSAQPCRSSFFPAAIDKRQRPSPSATRRRSQGGAALEQSTPRADSMPAA